MKKVLLFISLIGSIFLTTGCLWLFLGSAYEESEETSDYITFFDEPGDILPYRSFKVYQVLTDGSAIAYASEDVNNKYWYGVLVVIYNDNNAAYYDEQIIRLSTQKCRHIGTYKRYNNTYPVIRFE